MFDLVHKSEPFRLNQTCGCLRLQLQEFVAEAADAFAHRPSSSEMKRNEVKRNEMK